MTKGELLRKLAMHEAEALSMPLEDVEEELHSEDIDPQAYIAEVRRQLAALRNPYETTD